MEPTEEKITEFRYLVHYLASRYSGGNPTTLADYEAEGMLGLLRGIQKYDPGRGVSESTYYSHTILGAMRHYNRDRAHMIRVKAWRWEQGESPPTVVSTDAIDDFNEWRGQDDPGFARVEAAETLRALMVRLKPKQRATVELICFRDMTVAEAALHMGYSLSYVGALWQTAVSEMRQWID